MMTFLSGPEVAHGITWLQTEHLYLCVSSGPFPRKLPVFNLGSSTKMTLSNSNHPLSFTLNTPAFTTSLWALNSKGNFG